MNIKKPDWLAHYWILGFILAIIGLSYLKGWWQVVTIVLGIIIFISDLKSFSSIKVPVEKLPKLPEIKIKPGAELKKMFLPNSNPPSQKASARQRNKKDKKDKIKKSNHRKARSRLREKKKHGNR